MSIFDQRGQIVHGNQFNAAVGTRFNDVAGVAELVAQLQSLSAAVPAASVDGETAADVQHEIQQAIVGVNSGSASRTRDRLERARRLVEGIAGAGNLVTAITEAIHACARIVGS